MPRAVARKRCSPCPPAPARQGACGNCRCSAMSATCRATHVPPSRWRNRPRASPACLAWMRPTCACPCRWKPPRRVATRHAARCMPPRRTAACGRCRRRMPPPGWRPATACWSCNSRARTCRPVTARRSRCGNWNSTTRGGWPRSSRARAAHVSDHCTTAARATAGLARPSSFAQDARRPATDPMMTKKTKWLLAIVALILVALLAFVAAGPWLAINGIRNVVASGNYGELWRFVDFDRLRENVRPQIQARIAGGIIERAGAGSTTDAIAGVTDLISKPAIDAMVSPIGVATLLRGTALARQITGDQDADGAPRAVDPLKNAKTGYVSPSLFTATVQNAEGQPVVFEFSRSGLTWKLTGIDLPED